VYNENRIVQSIYFGNNTCAEEKMRGGGVVIGPAGAYNGGGGYGGYGGYGGGYSGYGGGGGVVIANTGYGNNGSNLVLNDGQQLSATLDPNFDLQKNNQVIVGSGQLSNANRQSILSFFGTLLVLATTALSLADAYLLGVAFECLEVNPQLKLIGLCLAGVSVAFSIIGAGIKVFNWKPKEDSTDAKKLKYKRIRNMGQILEDLSLLIALLPSLISLGLKASNLYSKAVAALAVAAAAFPLVEDTKEGYFLRKLFSLLLVLGAGVIFVFTFFSVSNDKSLVIYNFVDSIKGQTFQLIRQEDQVSYEGVRYCVQLSNHVCAPCIAAAVYGRGNNTWTPFQNENGQCNGISLSVIGAFDCSDQGARSAFSVSIFPEDTCKLMPALPCILDMDTGDLIPS
jgi:hypothetical protein